MTTRTRFAAALVALAAAVATPSAAHAGTNGQQLIVCPGSRLQEYGSAFVTGYNQDGRWSVSPDVGFGVPGSTYNDESGCATIWGYWWSGDVTIYSYEQDGTFYGRRTCNVPKWNPFTDLKRCDV